MADATDVENADHIPAIFLTSNSSCVMLGHSPAIPDHEEPTLDEDISQYLKTHPRFGWAVQDIKFAPGGIEKIVEQIKNGTARVMADGSTKDGRSSSGFLFIGDEEYENFFEGGNHIPGREKDQNSFRAELGGILALILIIEYICEKYQIEKGAITLGCDSTSALSNAL